MKAEGTDVVKAEKESKKKEDNGMKAEGTDVVKAENKESEKKDVCFFGVNKTSL